MKKNFKSQFVNFLILILSISLFIKILWFVVSLFLPITGVSKEKNSVDGSFYYPFTPAKTYKKVVKKPPPKPKKKSVACKEFKLKGFYDDGKKQFASITKGKKNVILSIQKKDTIDGYRLTEVGIDEDTTPFVLLEKGSKVCKVKFRKDKIDYSKLPLLNQPKELEREESNNLTLVKDINRKDILFYTKPENFNSIWRNIKIKAYKKNGLMEGYRVGFVKKGSIFEKIGLEAGDIIKAVNGRELLKDSDAIRLYKNIKKIDNLRLTILRNNEIKEIEYAIR